MEDQVIHVRQQLKETHARHKSYIDAHRIQWSYNVGDGFFIDIRLNKRIVWLVNGTKLSHQFLGSFENLEIIRLLVYHLVLPPNYIEIIMYFMFLYYDIA